MLTANRQTTRNLVLLFVVSLQSVHVFNCRSQTISAFLVPPLLR
jgi:hypothetical protein